MSSYPVKIDFLERIDNRLNELEMPLRARFFWGYVPKDKRGMSRILKADTRRKCHLKIDTGDKIYKVKYTTLLEPRTVDLHEVIPELYDRGTKEERLCLKLPLEPSVYRKTWGSCDLILCEWTSPKNKATFLYWIDAPLLLDFLERLKEPVEVKTRLGTDEERSTFYTREYLATIGLDVDQDLYDKLSLVRQIDVIDWEAGRIHAEYTSLFPTSTDKRGLDFTFRRNKDMKKAYWPSFKLKPYADQSRPITITLIDSGKQGTYPSAVAAVKDFETRGYKLRRASLSHVLRGRQKTIKTELGKITVRYAEVPKAS